jgi:hypothetical protein
VQFVPLLFVAWTGVRYRHLLKPEGKRTAVLQRRGLFDFISPFIVLLAGVSYFLFAAFVIHIEPRPPLTGSRGYLVIGCVTLVYAANAFVLDLQRWELFAQCVFFLICALLCFMSLPAPPRQPEADGLDSSPVP